jgi:L-fuculose-phosphate aldolase
MQKPTAARVASVLRRAVLECIASQDGRKNPSHESNTSEPASGLAPEEIFTSPAAQAIKKEILQAGKKLWERQYVDGNGGNISARVSREYVICTPTLCSKGDMTMDDLSLVDLDNRQICGDRAQTSEILLHLEIYKAVPRAQAVIHCHPPYATAHAVAGIIPRGNLIPEQEVFVGPVALAPYETPGTIAFARTILPFVENHNTILLANHGIVCWADTVAHAEWYAEVVENYCKIVVIASQLQAPIQEIPAEKISGLLAMKKRLGLPDPRLAAENSGLSQTRPDMHQREKDNGQEGGGAPSHRSPLPEEIDDLVARLTPQVLALLETRE